MQVVSKGMRATQLYLPNNPVYQRAVDNIRTAFRQIWQATDDLIFDIGETEIRWEDHSIYSQDQRKESIAWTLYKDGVRSLSFKPGVEDLEIVRFLSVLQQAKNLSADAPDDLLTLLWAEDFQFITYTFRELASENAVPIERTEKGAPSIGGGGTPGGDGGTADPATVRRQVEEEAPPKREGLVSVDDFDTTLYFLDDKEIEYLHKEVEREYGQDLRGNVLAMLFDLLELQTYGTVRAELISIIENFIPYLLGAGDFRSVAFILRECKVILQRARELIPEPRQVLGGAVGAGACRGSAQSAGQRRRVRTTRDGPARGPAQTPRRARGHGPAAGARRARAEARRRGGPDDDRQPERDALAREGDRRHGARRADHGRQVPRPAGPSERVRAYRSRGRRQQAQGLRPHRENGVLRSVRLARRRVRNRDAREIARCQTRPLGAERRSRNARLRRDGAREDPHAGGARRPPEGLAGQRGAGAQRRQPRAARRGERSEEHTSELQ